MSKFMKLDIFYTLYIYVRAKDGYKKMNFDSMTFRTIDLNNVYGNYNNMFSGSNSFDYGSIFSNYSYYMPTYSAGYCSNGYSFFAQLGQMAANIGTMALGSWMNHKTEQRIANSPETLNANLTEINKQIDAQVKTVGEGLTAEDVTNMTLEDSFTEAVTSAKEELNSAKENLSNEESKLTDVTGKYNNVLNKISDLQSQRVTLVQNGKDTTNIDKEIEALEQQRDAFIEQKENLEATVKDLEAKTKEPNGELYLAHKSAVDKKVKRETEIKNAQEALEPLIKQRNEIQAKLEEIEKAAQTKQDNKTLNVADKTIFGRTGEKKLRENGVLDENYDDASNLEEEDVSGLISMYRTGDLETKREVQAFFKNHNNDLTDDVKKGKSIAKAIDIIINADLG